MQFTPAEIWAHMGLLARLVVIVLGLMSVVSIYVIVERMMLFTKSRNESIAFAGKLGAMLGKGELDKAAKTKFGADVGYLGRVLTAGLYAYNTTTRFKAAGAGYRD